MYIAARSILNIIRKKKLLIKAFENHEVCFFWSHSIMQCHTVSHSINPGHTAPMQCHAPSYSVTQYQSSVTQHHAMSHSIVQCHTVSHSIMQCHTASCNVIQCHVGSCGVTWYHTVLCRVINWSSLVTPLVLVWQVFWPCWSSKKWSILTSSSNAMPSHRQEHYLGDQRV